MHVKEICNIYLFIGFWNIVDHWFKQEKKGTNEGGWILDMNFTVK